MRESTRPALLLATDTFGHTPEAQPLARQLGGAVRVVTPHAAELA